MKKIYLILLILLFTTEAFTQINFEKGYYINNDGKKIEGLIKNQDWKNNPSKFIFKTNANQLEGKNILIEDAAEFGIYNVSKYVRENVDIDRTSSKYEDLTTSLEPNYKVETLYLRVLIEGEKSLAIYEDGSLNRFFIKHLNSKYEPLVYKKYLVGESVAENTKFRQQLWVALRSLCIQETELVKLQYNRTSLKSLFIKYYNCNDKAFTHYNPKRDVLNVSLRLGLNSSSLSMKNSSLSTYDVDFGNHISPRLGLEFEIVLPFNKGKWGIIAEPYFQYYKAEGASTPSSITGRRVYGEAIYNSIELPIGVRHYFFLNQNSKIFINAVYNFYFPFNSRIDYYSEEDIRITSIEFNSLDNFSIDANTFALGLGYKLKKKIGVELRYQTGREVLNQTFWESKFRTMSFIVGYSFL